MRAEETEGPARQDAMGERTSSRKAIWLSIVAVVVVVVGVLIAGPLWRAARNTSPVHLTSGVYAGRTWALYEKESDGHFCMYLTVDPPSLRNASGMCGFTNNHSPVNYFYWNPGPPGSEFMFGPLPSNVVSVKVTPRISLPAHALPHRRELPNGRYWVWIQPAQLPKGAGSLYDQPRLFDKNGNRVAFAAFK